MRVVGIDLSLTATGLCYLDDASAPDGMADIRTVPTTGTSKDTLNQRWERLNGIKRQVERFVLYQACEPPDLVVIESPSYGSRFGAPHDRSGLWWLVVHSLRRSGVPVATVTPQGRAKYGTGSGASKKDAVHAAVIQNYPWIPVRNDNEADAVLLAAMGSRHLGDPVDNEVMTDKKLEAMEGAAWPA